jgi:hypothetical protein
MHPPLLRVVQTQGVPCAPEIVASQKHNARWQAGTCGEADKKSDSGNCGGGAELAQVAREMDRFNRVRRALQRLGFDLHPLADDTYWVTRWGLGRGVTLYEAERMLRQMGAAYA